MANENIESEVTGTVWKIECEVGDEVVDGDTLMILESMKMKFRNLSRGWNNRRDKSKKEDPVAEGDVVAVLEV